MMRIALRHRNRLIPKQSLDLVALHAALNQPRGESMSHIVKPEIWNPGPIAGLTKLPHQKAYLQEIVEGRLEY